MSIGANALCLECFLGKQIQTARTLGNEEQVTAFTKDLMAAMAALPDHQSTVCLAPQVTALFQKHFGLEEDRYRREKEMSNAFVMERFHRIDALAREGEDPLKTGLQLAILGNYLDFSALQGQVSFEKLEQMLRDALQMPLEEGVLSALRQDLARGKRLLYITDNAGEIGFDRVLARQIARLYPHLQITFLVRGGPAMNDATREDARVVGVEFPVLDNGACIPGTEISMLSPEAKAAMDSADVILAKGMANVETLYGSGYPVYYAFLVKCKRFQELFQMPQFAPMLLREQR